MDNSDIDYAWQYFHSQAVKRFAEFAITGFEVVMLSKHSDEVRAHIKKEKSLQKYRGGMNI